MTARGYAARPATEADMPAVAGLLGRVFDRRCAAADLLRKLTGPSGGLLGCALLSKGDVAVGFLGQRITRACLNGRDCRVAESVDAAIVKEHRRLDAYLTLVEGSNGQLREEGIPLVYGHANAVASQTVTELLGAEHVALPRLLVRPYRPRAIGGPWTARRWGARLLALAAGLCSPLSGNGSGFPAVMPLDRFDGRFDLFWEMVKRDYPIMISRDSAHLNWRYADAPEVEHERFCVEDASGGVSGYAVLRYVRHGSALRGRIADLLTPRSLDRRVADALIRAALARCRERKVDIADVWMLPHAHMYSAVRRRGFFPRRTDGGLCVGFPCPVPETVRLAVKTDSWFLSSGDFDTA